MPLYCGAVELLFEQLRQIQRGVRVPVIVIGSLTRDQHRAILDFRARQGFTGGESPEILYLGRHHYESRTRQGYRIEDLVLQIASALAPDAQPLLRTSMTSLLACHDRDDGYGHRVRDHAILELTARKPRIELFSVIPKGDGRQK